MSEPDLTVTMLKAGALADRYVAEGGELKNLFVAFVCLVERAQPQATNGFLVALSRSIDKQLRARQ